MFDSAYSPAPVHKLEAVRCDNCDSYHVECKFGCCYLDSNQTLQHECLPFNSCHFEYVAEKDRP